MLNLKNLKFYVPIFKYNIMQLNFNMTKYASISKIETGNDLVGSRKLLSLRM